MTKLDELANLGQSVWLDTISRSLLDSGELKYWIDRGLRGMTSNPTIFEKAISGSKDYDSLLLELAHAGKSTDEIFQGLAIHDIQQAADLLRPVYERTQRGDGYVSLEVDPTLAKDTQATLTQALELWQKVNRPNLMVKIPATVDGLPAIREAIAAGVNINITLIFSLKRYQQVMAAFLEGMEQRVNAGKPIDTIASVASFFVSRVDSKVDKLLEGIIARGGPQAEQASQLAGKAAVGNAKQAYQLFRNIFESERFFALQSKGAMRQRPLWASTSTKNPAYSDILYVQELIGRHTVNTMPLNTLEAFLEHGDVRLSVQTDLLDVDNLFQGLAELGIDMDQVTQELEDEGVAAFSKSFEELKDTIREKSGAMLKA
jgi:transaldolase